MTANQTKKSVPSFTSDIRQGVSNEGCLVLYSGGQDSATCLAWALEHFDRVETIGFDYGQRHKVELECRENLKQKLIQNFPDWAAHLGEDHMLDLAVLHQVSDCALTRETEIAFGEDGIPNSFVPGRNLLFFTFAATIAYRRGLRHIVGGMCETDYSGYPDCRDDTIKALQVAINLGLERRLVLHTPLMWLDKASTWQMAEEVGGKELVEIIRQESHSCYLGEREILHDWGYGCGHCPACELRAAGWESYQKSRS
ncbi:putative 7-cyano-7-deazaguanine synthase QueC [Zymomonas mobilis subsp. mobilis ZM4 = ATCC 31821]|uniref:7-cyano-7-deazaguanine synthase n=1 Tax=Zymomonas mobilis subsp. mobilis (strain ATCC 31821 / ZM4 / CP4) TaxID=264203 RepID=QUEC_ZYMMO|nr:7-cyano-7-deazaguanine synthase QueC [Zymomonas mobilis]Q5NNR3.1 RecName: Full=7-cyano-7-deazaguanine synthase; AltName: Full=7-cyano-7-carbaguanine synthase; AltName: Full=PreQ(0) synthase; AltName: Full=Queuosine biosynthesis protein QueC [Zymomonas mobilis subsp. mobilis ZM4 = ATCC 31821]AAV89647.1 exsB protein [Zymomonas mobilis subsp. mobilis ZM4 = ATCC 31821]AVZ25930.1 putative 7-cyano-7-deazaguanine synthase QueC [Zymomonas mobilis subsp. mobilis]AVZ27821.1 putative 7-cyano-7-deazagua